MAYRFKMHQRARRSSKTWLLVGYVTVGYMALLGCTTLAHRVAIMRSAYLDLLHPKLMNERRVASQIVRTSFRGKQTVLYTQVELDHKRLTMVGLTPVGVRLYTLQWNGQRVLYQPQPFFRAPIRPHHVLADFQLTFAPRDALKQALGKQGITIRESKQVRSFWQGQKELIHIRYSTPKRWQGNVVFSHRQRGYTLRIQTTQTQAIPPQSRTVPHKQ